MHACTPTLHTHASHAVEGATKLCDKTSQNIYLLTLPKMRQLADYFIEQNEEREEQASGRGEPTRGVNTPGSLDPAVDTGFLTSPQLARPCF